MAKNKTASTLNGFRAAVFFSSLGLFGLFALAGVWAAYDILTSTISLIAALVGSTYITRFLFGISPSDALFSTDDEIQAKRHR